MNNLRASGPTPSQSGGGSLRRAGVCPGHAEGNFVETFDGLRLDVIVETPVARGGVLVAIDAAGLRQRERQRFPLRSAIVGLP